MSAVLFWTIRKQYRAQSRYAWRESIQMKERSREVAFQALLFAAACLYTNMWGIIVTLNYLFGASPLWNKIAVYNGVPAFTSQGFLNFLVYIRPRYVRYRQKRPEVGRWGALVEVVFGDQSNTGSTVNLHTEEGRFAQQEMYRLQHDCGIHFHPQIPPNNSPAIQQLLDHIGVEPEVVIFDRFYNEEAYSFHFHELCPNAVLVLDMQDLHCLRHARQRIVQQFDNVHSATTETAPANSTLDCLHHVMNHRLSANDPRFLRELASCHRCDLILVCSPIEYDVLVHRFQLLRTKLCLAPFWVDPALTTTTRPSFEDTRDFVFVGGFRHDPNLDAVQILQQWIWPRIRNHLPTANLLVYGAYNKKINFRHDPSQGFHIMGYTPSLGEIFAKKRASLAPLRFGAGIKGKIVDSWTYGVPVITTPVGSEGMTVVGQNNSIGGGDHWAENEHKRDMDDTGRKSEWGGIESWTLDDFCQAAIDVYSSKSLWNDCRNNGTRLLTQLYPLQQWHSVVEKALQDAIQFRHSRRNEDVLRAMTWQQSMRSTKFFSKWIESVQGAKGGDTATTL